MIGIGLVTLWLGYAALATGRAYAKGIPVTFSDMVLPKYRESTIKMLQGAGAAGPTSGTPGAPGASGQTPIGPVSPVTQLGGAGFAGAATGGVTGILGNGLKTIGNGLSTTLKDVTGGLL